MCTYAPICNTPVCVFVYIHTHLYVCIFVQQQGFKGKLLALDCEKYKHIVNLFAVSTVDSFHAVKLFISTCYLQRQHF